MNGSFKKRFPILRLGGWSSSSERTWKPGLREGLRRRRRILYKIGINEVLRLFCQFASIGEQVIRNAMP